MLAFLERLDLMERQMKTLNESIGKELPLQKDAVQRLS